MRRNSNNLLMFHVKNIIKKLAFEIELTQIPELIPVSQSQIQNYDGVAGFVVENEEMKFYLKLNSKLISEDNIKNTESQLYTIIYHELCHLKNLELLSGSIPVTHMVNSIDNYSDKDSMVYNFAFMLWGEYYAYNKQFEKYHQILTEHKLLEVVKVFCDDIVKGRRLSKVWGISVATILCCLRCIL